MAAFAEDDPEWGELSDLIDDTDLMSLAPLAEQAEAKVASMSQLKTDYKYGDEEKKEAAKQAIPAAKREADKAEEDLQTAIVTTIHSKTGKSKAHAARAMKAWLAEKDLTRRKKLLMAAQSLDLCFVVDVTGSMAMGAILKQVQNTIRSTLNELRASLEHLKFRLSVVAYRDVNDSKRFEVHDFNSDIAACEVFLGGVIATGGGDQCEDVVGGLKVAADLEWKLMNRVLLLAADAPCHGSEFHDGCNDNYPSGTYPGSHDVNDVLQQLRQMRGGGVDFTFLKVNNTTDKMIEKFDEMGGGGWITTTDLSLGDAEEPDPKILRESIHKSIKEASLRSFTASSTKVSKLKSRTYDKAMDRVVASLGKIDEDEQDKEEESESIVSVDEALAALDLQGPATHADVKRAFKEKSLASHPDKPGGDSGDFRRVTEARTFLLSHLPEEAPATASAAAAEEPQPAGDRTSRLRELKSLLNEDLISQEEFDAQKERILSSI
mmetsp:Transcript_40793/g.93901  ORF Transcript_40793/g.93901 Transcript_40793/m.93901 type:complete len:492 (+) Transcript_40793:253-1728(+)